MLGMFCPVCSGRILAHRGMVVTTTIDPPRVALKFDDFLRCERCALVTEINVATGQLIDLGCILLDELQEPLVPSVDTPVQLLLQTPTLLHGRRDS